MVGHRQGLLNVPVTRVNEEAWGVDKEDPGSLQQRASAQKARTSSDKRARVRTTPESVDITSFYPKPQVPHALESLCIATFAAHLPQVLEAGPHLLEYVPPEAKAALLAVARRRNELTNKALQLLADSMWHSLDVSYTTKLTDNALAAVLQRLPSLRALDVSRSNASALTLRSLTRWCTKLEVLRVGGNVASNDAALEAMRHLLPNMMPVVVEVEDSWEAAAEAAAPVHMEIQLPNLQYVVWPHVPDQAVSLLRNNRPRVELNVSVPQVTKGKAPPSALLEVPLDQQFVQQLPPSLWMVSQACESTDTSLAERFRQAYVERETRLRAKAEKAAKQQRRKEAASLPFPRPVKTPAGSKLLCE